MILVSLRVKKILTCTLYNLLLEYWIHGIIGFMNPVTVVSLFFLYFFYFSMVEDLYVRYNLSDTHVLLIGFIYGMFQETFNTGSILKNPNFLGINVINVVVASIFWWGILQSVFALYFTNTLFHEFEEESMGVLGWILPLGFNFLLLSASLLEGKLLQGSISGYIVSIITMGVMAIILTVMKKPQRRAIVKNIRSIDVLIRVQLIICLITGTVVQPFFRPLAQYSFIMWSVIMGFVYMIHVFKGRRLIG